MGKDHILEQAAIGREIAQMSSKVGSLFASSATDTAKRNQLKKALEKLNRLTDPFSDEISKANEVLLIETNDWNGDRKDKAEEAIDSLAKSLSSLKNKLEDAKGDIEAEIGSLNGKINAHNNTMAALKKLISSKTNEMKHLND
ncbi:YwqH-like family protein [Latilactobacillus graminis]|uniref:DUF5082 domain-containing protein n=1 Tax=Latilactobacillus graminis TaxID=60519 RepID=A0ABX6C794_9LACO|nr:DUF5082 family protein [Latilactobacillus graminis]QFP79490.1 DUF5082 domain-containing protein [Latilactobacillus graminis]